jgi:hypothetical protein
MNVSEKPILPHPRSAQYERGREKQFPISISISISSVQLFSPPARARAAEILKLERTLSDLVNQAYALTPAQTYPLANHPAPHAHPHARNMTPMSEG